MWTMCLVNIGQCECPLQGRPFNQRAIFIDNASRCDDIIVAMRNFWNRKSIDS